MRNIAIACVLSFVMIATLIDVSAAEKGTQQKDSLNINELSGLYWKNHKLLMHPFTPADEYEASDVLEIVPFDKDAAYIRAKLNFDNGHGCGISGIAKQEDDKLVYYHANPFHTCVMEIVPEKDRINLIDRTGECYHATCGARGGYSGAHFQRSKKKNISYMDKLKNSPQYIDAVKNYKTRLSAEEKGITPQWAYAKDFLAEYAYSGNVEGVRQSLAQGADPNDSEAQNGFKPVSGSARSRNIEITQLMLDHGLDINAMQNGETLLTWAANNRNYTRDNVPPEKTYAYIQWLLKNGADPNIANTEGRMPAEIALFSEADQKIIDLLKENTNPKHADDHEQ